MKTIGHFNELHRYNEEQRDQASSRADVIVAVACLIITILLFSTGVI